MTRYLRLSVDDFDAIASALPYPRAVEKLREARLSQSVLGIVSLARAGLDAQAADLLAAAHEGDYVAVNQVLADPWVNVWAARVARDRAGVPDRDRFRLVAAAAAMRAGVEPLPYPLAPAAGSLLLPTLGALNGAGATDTVTLAGLVDQPGWQPIRHVDLGAPGVGPSIRLDDLDPYRDVHGPPAAGRLDDTALAHWRRMLRAAYELLAQYAPGYGAEIAAGLVSIVPLQDRPGGALSSTHGDGFGGFAMTRPQIVPDLAATMVHEFQHSKLNVLERWAPLCEVGGPARYFAPWRPDPRPLRALLHGAYAFVAVAQTWHALRAAPEWEQSATRRFAYVRAELDRACADLAFAPGLTRAGELLTERLGRTVNALLDEPVPRPVEHQAQRQLARTERQWRARHAPGTRRQAVTGAGTGREPGQWR